MFDRRALPSSSRSAVPKTLIHMDMIIHHPTRQRMILYILSHNYDVVYANNHNRRKDGDQGAAIKHDALLLKQISSNVDRNSCGQN